LTGADHAPNTAAQYLHRMVAIGERNNSILHVLNITFYHFSQLVIRHPPPYGGALEDLRLERPACIASRSGRPAKLDRVEYPTFAWMLRDRSVVGGGVLGGRCV